MITRLSIVLFTCIAFSVAGHAQQRVVNDAYLLSKRESDSVKRLLPGTADDILKVNRLIYVAQKQSEEDQLNLDYSRNALLLSEKLQYTEGVGHSYASIAASYQLMKRYDSAIYYFKKATSYFHDNGIKEDYYSSLLNVYFYLGDYPGAMETISEEMKLAEQTNDKIRVAHCNNILGYIYFKQENFPESEKYYNAYADNAIELKDTLLIAHALGEISDVYTEEKDYKRAINSLQTVISYSKQMLADTSIKRTYIAWAPQYIAKANFRLGRAYKLSGNLDSALYYSLGSLHTGTHNPGYDTAAFYINAGDVYRLMKKYPEAIFYLHHGYSLSREMNHRENTRDAAQYLSQTYAALNRYDSAFYYFQIFAGLKDSIVNNETKMKIAGIQGQYDIAKKNKEIARQQQIRNILIGSFLFFIIVLLLLYNRSRLVQKNRRQQEYSRQQNELFNAIVSTQDQERKRIAQDIHDSLGSVLSAAKLKLSSLEDSKRPLAPDQLEKYHSTLALLDDAVAELRSISHNIMPATLSKLGLVAALQNLIGKMSGRSAVQVSFTTHGLDERLEENTEISVYRIILELINNIVKHADAKKVSIQLIKYPKYINLIVEDNGKGFDHNKAMEEKRGIGLGNILSRVEFLKGNIDIDSSLGKGTTVIIDIPY